MRVSRWRIGGLKAPVDVLVNNAGIFHNAPAEEMSVDEWDRMLKVDLSSVYYCSRAFGTDMLARGTGAIVKDGTWPGVILRRWGCGLGQARRGQVCGWRRCRARVLAGRAACGIWRGARSLVRLRHGGLNRGPRSPAPGIRRLWPVLAARRSGRGRGQPGERA